MARLIHVTQSSSKTCARLGGGAPSPWAPGQRGVGGGWVGSAPMQYMHVFVNFTILYVFIYTQYMYFH